MYDIVQTNQTFGRAAADIEAAVLRHNFGVPHVHNEGFTLRGKGIAFVKRCKPFLKFAIRGRPRIPTVRFLPPGAVCTASP